jgi:hypothetical protein
MANVPTEKRVEVKKIYEVGRSSNNSLENHLHGGSGTSRKTGLWLLAGDRER